VANSLIIVHDFDVECAFLPTLASLTFFFFSFCRSAKSLRSLDVKLLLKGKHQGRPPGRNLIPREVLSDFNRVELLHERSGGIGMSLQFSACGRYLLSRRKEQYVASPVGIEI